jgi:hypothetical protein
VRLLAKPLGTKEEEIPEHLSSRILPWRRWFFVLLESFTLVVIP